MLTEKFRIGGLYKIIEGIPAGPPFAPLSMRDELTFLFNQFDAHASNTKRGGWRRVELQGRLTDAASPIWSKDVPYMYMGFEEHLVDFNYISKFHKFFWGNIFLLIPNVGRLYTQNLDFYFEEY